tara:strand:- start:36594 stop:37334 length:741 start_codon:yes stop_codon:yes gene_type:complete
MENWVITDCGKIIDIDGINGLQWRYVSKNPITRERINKFDIDESKFNTKTPCLEDVDNAIAEQYPNIVLEQGKYADWYLLNNLDYSPNKIKINSEEFALNIPNTAWKRLNVNSEVINTINYKKMFAELEYYNNTKIVKPLTNDLYLVAFYDIWCVFYRFKKIRGSVVVDSCLMRNNYSYCKDIIAMTYAKNIIKKDFIFSSVSGKNSYSMMSANLKLTKGWLETGYVIHVGKERFIPNHFEKEKMA